MRDSNKKEQEAQAICTSCGLCCDGTLFKHANLKLEDSDKNLNAVGMVAVQKSDKRFFQLPCHHLDRQHCKIYHLWRPSICGRFRCKILRRLSNGEISFEQGIEIVKKTLALIAEIKQKMIATDTSGNLNLHDRFKEWENKQVVPDLSVTIIYAALRFRLDRDFINNKKDSNGHSE